MPSVRLPEHFTPAGVVNKFGYILDIDATDTNEEVWSATGAYTGFVAAAAETSVVGGADDDVAGTGALTIRVVGLTVSGSSWVETAEDVIMTGATPAVMTAAFIRVYRAWVLTAGSGGVNAGAIQVKHGATVLADIPAGYGQTLQACYTVPDVLLNGTTISGGYVTRWYGTVGAVQSAYATIALQTRDNGGAWRTRRISGIAEGGGLNESLPLGESILSKTDIRIRVISNGANNSQIAAGFDAVMF